jgi:hypothetical protein
MSRGIKKQAARRKASASMDPVRMREQGHQREQGYQGTVERHRGGGAAEKADYRLRILASFWI